MSTFKKARSQRFFYGSKAREQNKKNRAESFSRTDANVISSHGYFKIQCMHAIFLYRALGTNPHHYLGESNIIKRLTNSQ